MRASFVFTLLLLAGCAERRFAGPPPPGRSAPPPLAAPAESASALALASPDGGAPDTGSWQDAVRLERWADAATRIDALPESVRARPDMRYVRARAAVGVGDGARAIALLDDLEPKLPLLAADIAQWRAEAQLIAGPYALAAAYFARSHSARDLTRAAEAYEKAGDTGSARATADRAVAAATHGKSVRDEVQARTVRASIARAHGGDALAEPDLRWLATHAALPEGAAPASEEVAKAPAKREARGEVLHARAMALWRAREYENAAKAFREAAAAKSGHEPEDLHYAARSLARADHDEDAVKTYRQVEARYPRSPFAERSAYFAARLELSGGHYKNAAQSYTRYLDTYRRGEHRDEAEYERALARMSSGGAATARKAFAALARKARDDRAARLRELEALAAARSGDKDDAVAIWSELARTQPLTWAALASRARLAAAGAPLPPLMEPQSSSGVRAPLDLRLPPGPALLASLGLDGDAEQHLTIFEREAVAPYAGRESEALCGLYGLLSRAKRRYRIGINAVDASWLYRAPSSGERWGWDCVYPRPFASGVRALEAEHDLPRGLVYAVMRQESGFDPAIVSPASAVGLMQLMPSTAKQAAAEMALPFDESRLVSPDVNLRLGAFYIGKLLHMWKGSVALAAAAYNAGPRAVSRWVEASADNDVDLWVARIPFEETRTYVARVVQNLARYQWLEGGDAAVTPLPLTIPTDARAPADAY